MRRALALRAGRSSLRVVHSPDGALGRWLRGLALQTERWSLALVHRPDGALWRWLRSRITVLRLVVALVLGALSCMGGVVALGVNAVWQESRVCTTELQMDEADERVELYTQKHAVPESLDEVYGRDGVQHDAWGHPILLLQWPDSGEYWDLVSLGADGRPGGAGVDADIRWSEQ